ncbi:MAG: 2-hydroxyacid dehydrogenase [Sphaerochaetaceae bacterium]|nr:2-hydroxyacid dehydrogenase [Sphaerochaetaceae bacterium]
MIKIAFFDTKPYDQQSFDSLLDSNEMKIKYFSYKLDEDNASVAKGYDVVCAFVNDNLQENVINILADEGIKIIAMRCAGYNNVDFKAAYKKIHVVRVPAYSPYAVAEHAFTLLTTLNRKTHKAYNRTRENNFNLNGLTGFDLHGKTIGIIGTGRIGCILAKIALGYGMNIIAYDNYPKEIEYIKYVTFDELLSQSDIISLHCPLTSETHHIINKKAIAKMKDSVAIINTSRGGLIDAQALIDGLKSRKIGLAGLDVYEEEANYFFEDLSNEVLEDDILARLLSFNNVLITSHQAFLTKEALSNIAKTTLQNIKDFFSEGPLENEICYQCAKKGKKECNHDLNKRCF